MQLQNTYDVGTQITDKLGKVCHRLLRCEPIQTVAVGGHVGVAFAIVADRKTDETTSLSWYHSHLYMIYIATLQVCCIHQYSPMFGKDKKGPK